MMTTGRRNAACGGMRSSFPPYAPENTDRCERRRLGPMMLGLGGPYGPAWRMGNEGLRGGGACRGGFVVQDAVSVRRRRLARGTGGRFLAMMSSRDLRGRAGGLLHVFGGDRQLEQGGARAFVCGVGSVPASVVGLDNLRRGW